MTNLNLTNSPETAPDPSALALFRGWAGSRIGLVVIAGVAIVAGLWFNWSWLVAAGVAPLIVGVLPCVAMCALGVCMMGMEKNAAAKPGADPPGTDSTTLPSSNDNLRSKAQVPDPSPADAE